jgi:Radical SAM superfamily
MLTPIPRIIAIELTNKCNQRCNHCPQGVIDIKEGFMTVSTFRKCLPYCSGYTELNWRGEPLLHPNLLEFILIAKTEKPDLRLGFHTNSLLLTKDCFLEFVRNGLDWLHISLHTEMACNTYLHAKEWNAEFGNPVFLYADTDTTHEQLMALSFGIPRNEFHHDHIANWAGRLTQYRKIHNTPEEIKSHSDSCPFIVDNIVLVSWDGQVNACCWDFEMKHSLGNIDEFISICHHPPYVLCPYCIWERNYEELPK